MGMGNPLVAMLANSAAGAQAPAPDYPRLPNGDPDVTKMTPEQLQQYTREMGIAPAPSPSPSPTPGAVQPSPAPAQPPAPGQPVPPAPGQPAPGQPPAADPGFVQSIINWFLKGTSAKDLQDGSQQGGGMTAGEAEQRQKRMTE